MWNLKLWLCLSVWKLCYWHPSLVWNWMLSLEIYHLSSALYLLFHMNTAWMESFHPFLELLYIITLIILKDFHLILKSHQMALFSFPMLYLEQNTLIVWFSHAELQLHPWRQWSWLTFATSDSTLQRYTAWCHLTAKNEALWGIQQLNICVTLWTRRSVTPWSEIYCYS